MGGAKGWERQGHWDGCVGWERAWGGVHLTKGHPSQSSTKLGHKMSLHSGWGGRGTGEEGMQVCGGYI